MKNLIQNPFLLLLIACAGLFSLPMAFLTPDEAVMPHVLGALAGLVCVALVRRIGVLWKSELVGNLAAAILASSIGFFALTQTPGPSLFLTLGMALALDISLRLLLGRGQNKLKHAIVVYVIALIALLLTRHLWPLTENSYFPDPVWSFVLGFLPWLVFLPQVVQRWSRDHGFALRRDEGAAFLIGAVVLSLGLGWPVLIPLSVLVAGVWEEDWVSEETAVWVSTGLVSLNLIVLITLVVLKWPTLHMTPFQEHSGLFAITLCVALILMVGVWGMRKTAVSFGGILLAAVLLLGSLVTLSTYLHAEPSVNLLPPGTAAPTSGPIDPESAVEFVTVPIVEPPARVALPEPMIRKDQWKGPRCAVGQARQAVIRHADAWARFWNQGLSPYSPRLAQVPVIDFTKDMVVGVFLGEKPDPHYEIEILSIKKEKKPDGSEFLKVRYRERETMRGVFSPPFAVQPFHLRRVPVFTGPIVFEKVQR